VVSVIGYFGVKYLITPELIEKVFTADFDISKQVLMILLTGIFIFFVTQPLSWFLVIFDKQKILPLIYGISALFNVSLNYYLIPKYSFIASSYLTWLSELVTLILLSFFTLKYWPRNAR
jgi:O-antigen/teichoic acid export membrane protein